LRLEDCPRALAARFGLIERRALRLLFCSCIVPRANGMRGISKWLLGLGLFFRGRKL
jgi:hypothetical protein